MPIVPEDKKEAVKEKLDLKKEKDPKQKLDELFQDMEKKMKEMKKKFDKSDDKTKQKIIAAGAGAIGLIVGVLGGAAAKAKHRRDKK